MRAQALANALGAQTSQHEPKLEGAKAASELQAVIHIISHVAVGRRQVLRNERERAPHHRLVAHVQHRAVHRHEHPFVRIDDQRIGARDAVHEPRELGHHRRDAGVRRVDVQPHRVRPADLRDSRDRVDGRGRGRADRRDDRERPHARSDVARDGPFEVVGDHAVLRIARDANHVGLPDAQRDRRLFNVRVRVLGEVDAHDRQVVSPGHAASREYPDRATRVPPPAR